MNTRSTLDNSAYNRLVQILIGFLFQNSKAIANASNTAETQFYPEQQRQLKTLMLKQFALFHQQRNFQLETNAVWRLCIYYKMVIN